MTMNRDPSKALQWIFLALLIVCMAQAAYWISDNVLYTRTVERRFAALYTEAAPDDLRRLLAHLQLDSTAPADVVRAAALADLAAARAARTNRYIWEGGFFLAVLFGGTIVLLRAIRHDRELRRRQQNFLAAVSHEFKSPLASVQLAAETLVLRSGDPDSRRLGQRILDDGERLLRMVDNLLDTARLEEGRHALAPEPIVLRTVVETGIAEIAERAHRHGIGFRIDVPEALALSVDRAALESMLRNLLDNALKSCIAAAGERIEVSARHDGGRISVAVSDDGLGFAPADAEMMFEKFYRLGDELRRTTPGTGLGLYIVKRLVEMSGAQVSATSAGAGCGAAVTITWPESVRA
jgi:signal transduction histidine kinase